MPAKRTIVTAALPYANGSVHLGHLVEYCQADMYVRALKRLGEDALYICANDAHGTPIEVNAGKLGIKPEELVARVHEEQKRDFATFDVAFDHFSITHSDTNRALVERVYKELRAGGHLEDRDTEGSYCEHDQRFLPDRFVRGTCPKCKAEDQYGDVCEACHSTYSPADLIKPSCVLCGNAPVRKSSRHVFFKLSADEHVAFLREWIDSGALQKDQANYVRSWIEGGLRDWCITRDGPYFGFAVPDQPDKYFYVWLDAPLGYAAASTEWGEANGATFEQLWQNDEVRIEHIIGKDIVYFHTLFWPAVLRAVGFTLPSKVHVHGMLTIDGKKMSKSRGTFINGSTFAEQVEPQALRYYYACKYSAGAEDLDLAFDDFINRINSELVNKHANLFSRAAQFLNKQLDGKLGDLPFAQEEAQAEPDDSDSLLNRARRVVALCRQVEKHYRAREFGHAMRNLCAISDIGNEYVQERAPWAQLKAGDEEGARLTLTFALNICQALAIYLWPIVPRFAEAGARILSCDIDRMDSSRLFGLRQHKIGEMERLFDRIERTAVDAVIEASTQSVAGGASKAAPEEAGEQISFADFQKLDLRIGEIKSAEPIKKSKKLLRLEVDIGEEKFRQVVAGIATSYQPEELIGKRVVVLANLEPAKLMGVESQGMVLAAEHGDELSVLRLDRELPPGSAVR